MPFYSTLRVASLAATFALTAWCGPRFYVSVIVSLALSHYGLALVYSRRQMVQLAFGPGRATLKDLALPAIVALSMLRWSGWNGYGILHYMLGDVAVPQRPIERFRRVLWTRFALNLLFSLVIYRTEFRTLNAIGPAFLWIGSAAVAVTFFLFVRSLLAIREEIGPRAFRDQILFESLMLGLFVYCFFGSFSFEQASLNHFLFWAFLPATGYARVGPKPLSLYLVTTVAAFGAVFLFTPALGLPMALTSRELVHLWILGNNFHTVTSLLLSTNNPLFPRYRLPSEAPSLDSMSGARNAA